MAEWKSLTRNDLRGFDDNMTKAVLYAMEQGGVGRISNNGHAILRNNHGQTMSVSRSAKAGNRVKQNVARDLTRLFGSPVANERPDPAPTQGNLAVVPDPGPTEVIRCIAKGCAETFVTEGARYSHVERDHYRCREDGCNAAFTTPQGQAGHRRIVHEGHKPRKGKGPKQQAAVRRVQNTPDLATVPDQPAADRMLPTEPPKKPKPQPAPQPQPEQAQDTDAAATLARVRQALGEDPRIAQLEREVEQLRRERDDLKAQLGLVREALHLS